MTRSAHTTATAGVLTLDDGSSAVVGDHTNSPHWLGRVRDSAPAVPLELRRELRALQRDSGPTGSLLVRGLPVDNGTGIPPTPSMGNSVQRNPTVPTTAQTLYLGPGDLAVVDNRVTLHGRTAFRSRYDGLDRWLQRDFSVRDLCRSRDYRPADGHVLVR
jgi:hypothetical protein